MKHISNLHEPILFKKISIGSLQLNIDNSTDNNWMWVNLTLNGP